MSQFRDLSHDDDVDVSGGDQLACVYMQAAVVVVVVTCRSFNLLIGDLNELRYKDYGDTERGAQR